MPTETELENLEELNQQRMQETEEYTATAEMGSAYSEGKQKRQQKTQTQIGPFLGSCMIGFALCVDAVQVLLGAVMIGFVINWVISVGTWILFFLFLKFRGIPMLEGKGAVMVLSSLGTLGAELVPLLDWLPAWTTFAVGIIIAEHGKKLLKFAK